MSGAHDDAQAGAVMREVRARFAAGDANAVEQLAACEAERFRLAQELQAMRLRAEVAERALAGAGRTCPEFVRASSMEDDPEACARCGASEDAHPCT